MVEQGVVVEPEEGHVAHIPVAANGKPFCATVKDHNNPYSVWSVSPPRMRDAIDTAPDDLYLLEESAINKKIGNDPRCRTLRISFQREYERVLTYFQRTGVTPIMRMTNVFGGICSEPAFSKLIKRPEVVVFLTMPIVDYFDSLGALQMTMLQRYQEILNAKVVDKDGKLIVGAARVVLEAIRGIEDRVLGKAVQRISSEMKSVQVTVPVAPRSLGQTTDMMLDMERRIKELSAELYGVRMLGEGDQRAKAVYPQDLCPQNRINIVEVGRPGWTERKIKAMEGASHVVEPEEDSGAAEDPDGSGSEGHSTE